MSRVLSGVSALLPHRRAQRHAADVRQHGDNVSGVRPRPADAAQLSASAAAADGRDAEDVRRDAATSRRHIIGTR